MKLQYKEFRGSTKQILEQVKDLIETITDENGNEITRLRLYTFKEENPELTEQFWIFILLQFFPIYYLSN